MKCSAERTKKWFTALNVVPKIQTTQKSVLNVEHLFTQLEKNADDITENMNMNVSEFQAVAQSWA